MKRTNGFIDLKELGVRNFFHKETDGRSCLGWFEIDGTEYLFKTGDKNEAIKEMFFGFIYDALNEKNVHYDLAKYENYYGVISKQYNVDNLPTYSLYKILNPDKKIGTPATIHCYQNVISAYSNFFENIEDKDLEELKKKTLECFIYQLLFGNRDLHETNLEIYGNTKPKVSPFYDFEKYGSIFFDEISPYSFSFKYSEVKKMEVPLETLNTFLMQAEKEEIEVLKEKMESIKEMKLRNIYQKMQSQIHAHISFSLKRKLKKQVIYNTDYIRKMTK